MLSYSEWQMSYGERAALEGILAQQRPRLAVEIGTANGGSLARIASYSEEVHSFDLVPPANPLPHLDNITYHTGDSHVLLAKVLDDFARGGRCIDFVLVDGDHSADGVRRDIRDLLSSDAVADTVIVLHDTLNEIVREGIESVDFAQWPKVSLVELDLVPGYLARREPYRLELWGGLGLIIVDAASGHTRTGPSRDDRFYELFALVRPTRDVMSEIERGGQPLDTKTSAELAQLLEALWKSHRDSEATHELRRSQRLVDQAGAGCGRLTTAPSLDEAKVEEESGRSMTSSRPGKSESLANTVNGVPERFVPEEMKGQLVEAEHIARYSWVTSFCQGRRVLDAGCGLGYGAAMLKLAGASDVVAVDKADEIVEVARQRVPPGVSCETADIADLPFGDDSFDLVVCLEVIEHVEAPDAVLDEFARVLGPQGLLVISSPNRERYVAGDPHHRHEYSRDELRSALRTRFPSVALVPQHVMLASVIDGHPSPADNDQAVIRRLVTPDPDGGTYMLALAGDEVPEPLPNLVGLTQFVELRRWLARYDEQAEVIRRQSAMLDALESVRAARDQAIALLERAEEKLIELPELRESVRFRADEADRLRREAAEMTARLARAERVVTDVTSSMSWRVTTPLRNLKQAVRSGRRR
jgi:2-polyprenyl-3-methyl-5-hydroxy-6-metoxy-1,4-benzoquinol methylase